MKALDHGKAAAWAGRINVRISMYAPRRSSSVQRCSSAPRCASLTMASLSSRESFFQSALGLGWAPHWVETPHRLTLETTHRDSFEGEPGRNSCSSQAGAAGH